MLYAIIGIVLATVAFALAAVVDVHVFGEIDRLERQYNGVNREMEVMLDSISGLTMDAARLKERIDMLEDRNAALEKKIDFLSGNVAEIDKRSLDAKAAAEEIVRHAEDAAKEVGKQWSDGIQNMLGWNPFTTNEGGGGT